jgi:hypothetical protein
MKEPHQKRFFLAGLGEGDGLDTAIIVVNTPSTANCILRLLGLGEKEYGHS